VPPAPGVKLTLRIVSPSLAVENTGFGTGTLITYGSPLALTKESPLLANAILLVTAGATPLAKDVTVRLHVATVALVVSTS